MQTDPDSNKVLIHAIVLSEIEKDATARNQKKQDKSKSPESSPIAKAVSIPESPADTALAQDQPKKGTAYFF